MASERDEADSDLEPELEMKFDTQETTQASDSARTDDSDVENVERRPQGMYSAPDQRGLPRVFADDRLRRTFESPMSEKERSWDITEANEFSSYSLNIKSFPCCF